MAISVHNLITALCQFWLSEAIPVVVNLHTDAVEVRPGDPVLLKVSAVNKSSAALQFHKPLNLWSGNLFFECKPPGEEKYIPIPRPTTARATPGHSRGWEPEARHVCHVYLFRQRIPISKDRQPVPVDKLSIRTTQPFLSCAGDWYIRAGVVAGRVGYRSAPVRIRVAGIHPKAVADALDACEERLRFRLIIKTILPPAEDVALFRKHLPALADTPAALPLRRYLLLNEVATASTAEARNAAVARVQEFRKKCPPLEQEYTELLLGVALVKAKDIPAAQGVLRNSKDELSDIKQFLIGETAPKEDK